MNQGKIYRSEGPEREDILGYLRGVRWTVEGLRHWQAHPAELIIR